MSYTGTLAGSSGKRYVMRDCGDGTYRPFLDTSGDTGEVIELVPCAVVLGCVLCQLPAGHQPSKHDPAPAPPAHTDQPHWALHRDARERLSEEENSDA